MSRDVWACNCIGPQRGEPYCPCAMKSKGVYQRDGRWIEPEKDLGSVYENKYTNKLTYGVSNDWPYKDKG